MTEKSTDNNKRIAKNTMLLYVRMLFTMGVSLYTSRVVLNTLGVEDFGIYNVVGGVVTMLGFFNSSMATSTQRFLNYEMGKGNHKSLQEVFSSAINAHYLIGIISILALESVGLWFLYNKLNIPVEQFESAIWVFHCSVLSFFISIISTPYNAAIIANEKMDLYAYLSILEVFLKLVIVYLLVILPGDKLKTYALLLLSVTFLMRILYNTYCIKTFKECKYKWFWSPQLLKKIFSFSGWMIFGCLADMLSSQGVNILINIFFGPVFNASRAIAVQIQNTVNSFVANFMTAVRPQIIKSYSQGNFEYTYKLVFSSSKLSYFLLFLLSLPILLNTEYILTLWLKRVPEYSILFTQLVIIELLIRTTYAPIAQINQASGKIRNYQLAISLLFMANFGITYLIYKMGMPVYSTFYVSIAISLFGLLLRIFILKRENDFPAKSYLKEAILPLIPITIIPLCIYYFLISKVELSSNFLTIIMQTAICFCVTITTIWFLGINTREKKFIYSKILKRKV